MKIRKISILVLFSIIAIVFFCQDTELRTAPEHTITKEILMDRSPGLIFRDGSYYLSPELEELIYYCPITPEKHSSTMGDETYELPYLSHHISQEELLPHLPDIQELWSVETFNGATWIQYISDQGFNTIILCQGDLVCNKVSFDNINMVAYGFYDGKGFEAVYQPTVTIK